MSLESNEALLAKQAQQGSREAFVTLYNLYLNRVHNRVKSRVPIQDVEDVVQDIFIAVIRSLDSFELRSNFGTWLYTIVNRQIADFYRKRYRTGQSGDNPNVSLDDAERIADPVASDREDHDERIMLQSALHKLPEHYQEVILLRFADKLTFEQIARQRGQSLEAVKSLHRRALQALRTQIVEA